MTREDAVTQLMKEWKAKESFRPFFERMVNEWMGEAKNVLESDYIGIRKKIQVFK